MILPTKGLAVDRALLSIGADVLRHLRRPITVSGLWDEIRKRRSGLTQSISYDWFVLALDLLFLCGVVELSEGRLRRIRRGGRT